MNKALMRQLQAALPQAFNSVYHSRKTSSLHPIGAKNSTKENDGQLQNGMISGPMESYRGINEVDLNIFHGNRIKRSK